VEEGIVMHAAVGDEVFVDTETLDVPRRRGRVLDVLVGAGEEHYRVARADGRESLFFPGPDVRVVRHAGGQRPAEQVAARPTAGGKTAVGQVPAGWGGPAPTDPVRTIMSTPVSQVDGQASLREVAEALTSAGVGALVVVDGERTLGVVSERDVVRALAQGGDPDLVWAADVLAPETVWVRPADSIRAVAGLMWDAEVRHIPLRENGKAGRDGVHPGRARRAGPGVDEQGGPRRTRHLGGSTVRGVGICPVGPWGSGRGDTAGEGG
jgi:CBS domain-containing protein